mmetsp:Transcript_421/g.492  ORF Transcript_421/g.492 Transcript_421/m.492 type:complete len:349 (-) Transcript_421:104-1150(-)
MVKFALISLALVVAKSLASAKKLAPIFKNANKLPQTPRRLEDAEEEDIAFLSGYNVLYQNCFVESRTISFKLCPSDDDKRDCDQDDCEGGGEYLVDMDFFLDAFTEMQMDAGEYRCEMARENCEDENDDAVADCYINQGWDDYESYANDCEDQENDGEEEEFNLQEYLECKEFDEDYYVGPKCADSVNIYLALFTDEDCLYDADVTPEDLGYDMPYSVTSGTSIIDNECASCTEHGQDEDQNGGDDEEDEDDVIEQCEELYADSNRCESEYMTVDDHEADGSSCEYIASLKENEASFLERGSVRSTSSAGTIAAIIGGVAAVLVLVGAVFYISKKKGSDDKKENLIAE